MGRPLVFPWHERRRAWESTSAALQFCEIEDQLRTNGQPTPMDATLNKSKLLEVIAALTSRRESGRLQINGPGRRGAFFFKNGKLVDAHMGPFSGFPAVNLAVSTAEATFRFDSSIPPPSTPGFIPINERLLLRERFGIDTIDVEIIQEEAIETEDVNGRSLVETHTALTETSPQREANNAQESAYKLPTTANTVSGSGARESRRRAAKNRRVVRKRTQTLAIPDQFRSQTAEAGQTMVDEGSAPGSYREENKDDQRSDSPITLEPPPNEPDSGLTTESTAEEARPGPPSNSEITFKSFAMEVRQNAGNKLLWTAVILTVLVSGVGSYWLNNFFSSQPGAPAQTKAELKAAASVDVEQPVIEGALHGKEATIVMPEYPSTARSKAITGQVTVSVRVNKQGDVVSARAVNGDPLLRPAAVTAARKAKFSPEKLVGEPSRISGTITYTFKL
jgi:TonB family protein